MNPAKVVGKPNLIYFDMRGKGDQIELLLKEAKVEYKITRITSEIWPTIKDQFDYGQIPALEIDGQTLVQTEAIMIYLGIKYGFFPQDADSSYNVMWWIEGIQDLTAKTIPWYFEKDLEVKMELAKVLRKEEIPRFLGIFEKKLGEKGNSLFCVGDGLTVADFVFGSWLKRMPEFEDFKCLEAMFGEYWNIKHYYDKWMKYFYEE